MVAVAFSGFPAGADCIFATSDLTAPMPIKTGLLRAVRESAAFDSRGKVDGRSTRISSALTARLLSGEHLAIERAVAEQIQGRQDFETVLQIP